MTPKEIENLIKEYEYEQKIKRRYVKDKITQGARKTGFAMNSAGGRCFKLLAG